MLAIVLAVVASVVVARLGGPAAKGVAATFAATVTTVYSIASLGVPEQIVQFAGVSSSAPRKLLLRAWTAFLLVGAGIAVLLLPWSGDAAVLAIGCLFYLIPAQAGIVALGSAGVIPQAFGAVLQPAGLAVSAVAFSLDGSLTGSEAAWATALSYLGPLVVYWRVIPRSDDSVSWVQVRDLFIHGSKWQLPNLAVRVVQRSDVLVVFVVLGAGAAGTYSVATQLSELCFLVPRQFAGQVYHRISTAGTMELRRTLVGALVAAGGTAVAVGLVGWVAVVPLYGDAFEDARWLLLLLLPGPVLGSGALVLSFYFRATSQFRPASVSSLVGAIIVVVLALILVPVIGYAGAAVASSTAWLAYSAAATGLLRLPVQPGPR